MKSRLAHFTGPERLWDVDQGATIISNSCKTDLSGLKMLRNILETATTPTEGAHGGFDFQSLLSFICLPFFLRQPIGMGGKTSRLLGQGIERKGIQFFV
jgi:hypothetical protein